METNEKTTMTCIICPMGCQLEVTKTSGNGEAVAYAVAGNACKRGEEYARKELTNPERTLTCTVQVAGGAGPLVPAKSKSEIPRDMQLECMEVIKRLCVKAPVRAGDVLLEDILNTGADIIACDDIAAR